MTLPDSRHDLMLQVFLGELLYQSQFAAKAAARLSPDAPHEPLEIWSAVQSLLIAAGNVSKILWPVRSQSAQRGALLRTLLAIDGNSVLSDRTLRNHCEHYDERIEDWFSSPQSAVYEDQAIGTLPRGLLDRPQNAHRHYDPRTQVLTFRGESRNLAVLVRALDDLGSKCSQYALGFPEALPPNQRL